MAICRNCGSKVKKTDIIGEYCVECFEYDQTQTEESTQDNKEDKH